MLKAVIVGAGPAGILAAMCLAQHGVSVKIFDSRPAPTPDLLNENKSYPMVLSVRGQRALTIVPGLLDWVKKDSVLLEGAINHTGGRARMRRYKVDMLNVTRDSLTYTLMTFAAAKFQDQFTISWEHSCIDVNVVDGVATFKGPDGQSETVSADVIVGADGLHSIVRMKMAEQPGYSFTKKESGQVSRTLAVPSPPPEWGHAVHVWVDAASLILAPSIAGKYAGVVYNREDDPVEAIFTDPSKLKQYFQKHFPEAVPHIPESQFEALCQKPTLRPVSLRVSQLHCGRALLIGDAAHAMNPSLGQGVNSALDDVYHLNSLLDPAEVDWPSLLPKFTAMRLADAHAIVWLSENSAFPRSSLGLIWFMLKGGIVSAANAILPKLVPPPAFIALSSTCIPYSSLMVFQKRSQFFFERFLPLAGLVGIALAGARCIASWKPGTLFP